jgi:Ssp1 endopeptidase immunity protein Rap1a
MKPIFAIALGAVVGLLAPGRAGAQTTNELLKSCEAVTNAARSAQAATIDIPRAGIACWNYMAAIQNASVLVDKEEKRLLGVCAPPDATLLDHVRIVVEYARRDRKNAPDNAAALAVMALSEAFPCKGN